MPVAQQIKDHIDEDSNSLFSDLSDILIPDLHRKNRGGHFFQKLFINLFCYFEQIVDIQVSSLLVPFQTRLRPAP